MLIGNCMVLHITSAMNQVSVGKSCVRYDALTCTEYNKATTTTCIVILLGTHPKLLIEGRVCSNPGAGS